jgi:hypothetical protein
LTEPRVRMEGIKQGPMRDVTVESHPNVEQHDARMGHPA